MRRVFISGCWDLFHIGHLECLEFAKAQGDYLVVSVASDETVRALKREPIYPESHRLQIIRGLKCVDEAFIAHGEPSNMDFRPYLEQYLQADDAWVVSWDDKLYDEKVALAEALGAEIVKRIRPEQTPTTSSLIEKIRHS